MQLQSCIGDNVSSIRLFLIGRKLGNNRGKPRHVPLEFGRQVSESTFDAMKTPETFRMQTPPYSHKNKMPRDDDDERW